MSPEPNPPAPFPDPAADPEWDERLRYWRRKLGRIRLGVEPVEDQLARYYRVTLMLTALPAGLALIFVALFAAFGRPDVGLVLVLILLAPVVAMAWIDYALLRSRALGYLRELRDHEAQRAQSKTPGGA
jgi:hypothetical protein